MRNVDISTGLIVIAFIGFILIYIQDLRDLIIPTKKKTIEIVFLAIGTIVILGITYFYGKTWLHYILGILGTSSLILSFMRTGITHKGFRSIRWTGRSFGNWNQVQNVQIFLKKDVKVSFISKDFEDIHYYKKEDYDKIINLLLENLSSSIVEIK